MFCLIYNSYVVEYDDEEQGTQDKEAVVFKELYNFNQKSLDEKGVFLMDFSSEAFIWVGKKVIEKDRVFIP